MTWLPERMLGHCLCILAIKLWEGIGKVTFTRVMRGKSPGLGEFGLSGVGGYQRTQGPTLVGAMYSRHSQGTWAGIISGSCPRRS